MELRDIAKKVATVYGCNCDLDNWQPEPSTGHSWVCRIHKQAIALKSAPKEQVEAWVAQHRQAATASDKSMSTSSTKET